MGRSGWLTRYERVKIILYFMKSETSAAQGGRFKLAVNIIQHILYIMYIYMPPCSDICAYI